MYEGEVVQLGTPQELFERPAHRFVGYFIGSPGMNFLPCRLRRRRRRGSRAPTPSWAPTGAEAARERPSAALEIGIRPEFVRVARQPDRTTPAGRDRRGSRIWATTSW